MDFNLRKLKYNIWFYFLAFAIVLLVVLWISQVTFLENYYLRQKQESLIACAEKLRGYITANDDSGFSDEANTIKDKQNITVILSEGVTNLIYPADNAKYVKENYLELIISSYGKLNASQLSSFCTQLDKDNSGEETVYVYAEKLTIESASGGTYEYMLMLVSSLSVINEAVATVQTQLLYVTAMVLVIAFIVGFFISGKLSKPLTKMSGTANELAHGDYNVTFEASGYTEVRELANALNFAKDELAKAGTLQRDLLANITHDLKTPLTMIKAYAEMIMDISGDVKVKRDKHAMVIINEADRLTMLVNDILHLSKLQTDVDTLDLKRTDLSALTAAVIDQFSSFLEKEGYSINFRIEKDIFCVIDAKKIEQVIYNLIGNAINYTGDDKQVSLSLERHNGKALLQVIDTGKGIDPDKIVTIWDKYYRASETHKRPVSGTGLGLSIVKAILENHNLRYGVISKPQTGSNFFVEFDVDESKPE